MTPSPRDPSLTVVGLGHRYGRRVALEDLALSVPAGAMVGLLGPNGSGKSTALAMLAGVLPIQRGAATWRGRDGVDHAAGSLGYRARLGVVFQRPSLDAKLTAQQNLMLAARMHGIGGRVARERAAELLAWAGLTERAKDAVGTFSGGMARRLEIARALVHEPELVLLDEPTSGLDAASFERTWSLLGGLRRTHGEAVGHRGTGPVGHTVLRGGLGRGPEGQGQAVPDRWCSQRALPRCRQRCRPPGRRWPVRRCRREA